MEWDYSEHRFVASEPRSLSCRYANCLLDAGFIFFLDDWLSLHGIVAYTFVNAFVATNVFFFVLHVHEGATRHIGMYVCIYI